MKVIKAKTAGFCFGVTGVRRAGFSFRDGVIVNSYVYFGKKEIDALKKCKVISFQSTGYNEVDLEYAEEKGVAVVSILDYCTQETAENAFAMMLCLQRAIRIYDRSVQVDKEWNYLAAQHLQRIEGQTMGIVGLGRIGQSVARTALKFPARLRQASLPL